MFLRTAQKHKVLIHQSTAPLLTQQQKEILPHALVQDEKRKSHANNILLSVNIAAAT